MRCLFPTLTAALLLGGLAACAHDHWIVLERMPSGEVACARLRICSGHAFPESEVALAERMLAELEIVQPDRRSVPYKPTARGKAWETDIALDKPGVWLVSFALKKPELPEPLHRGRAIAIIGDQDDPLRYVTNRGLEIAPEAPLASLKPDATIPLSLRLDGARLAGKIEIVPEKGSATILSTAPDRPAQFRLCSPGAYLFSASHKGKSCSLTFTVPALPRGESKP